MLKSICTRDEPACLGPDVPITHDATTVSRTSIIRDMSTSINGSNSENRPYLCPDSGDHSHGSARHPRVSRHRSICHDGVFWFHWIGIAPGCHHDLCKISTPHRGSIPELQATGSRSARTPTECSGRAGKATEPHDCRRAEESD